MTVSSEYRQDAQTSGTGLGAYLHMLADLLDGEDLDGQRNVIDLAQQYLAGGDRVLAMAIAAANRGRGELDEGV
jgi:hypothetical protein